MKKFAVTFYYHTNCVVEVEAENAEMAISKAESEMYKNDEKYEKILWEGLQEDDSPTIEEI